MLWRVRTTLPDRPGSLASLARRCGHAGVNILGLQIFPGVESVTDELVVRTPSGWGVGDIAELVRSAGAGQVVATRCTEAALVDQPTRYVQAARAILARPMSFPEVVADLFDADAEAVASDPGHLPDVMEMTVADVQVQIRRTALFTATEHARGAALADLVTDVLQRSPAAGAAGGASEAGVPGSRTVGSGSGPEYVVSQQSVSALLDGVVIGLATLDAGPPMPAPMPAGMSRPTARGRRARSRSGSTRPTSVAASAPGCWSRLPGWRGTRARPRSC